MKKFIGFGRGMGIGGWLTNYKRFNVLSKDKWSVITLGDMEHFQTYITENDIKYISELGMDHIRLGFDQIVIEEQPHVYREEILKLIDNFIEWCQKYGLNVVLNLHKAIGNYCDIEEDAQLLDSDELQQGFINLWIFLEKRYSSNTSIAFELLNEVRDVEPQKWNGLASKTVSEIRKLNPNRKIIIGSTSWNSPKKLNELQVFDDENIVYTFHMYDPYAFTHQRSVLQPKALYYNRIMPYPSDIERYRDYQVVVNGKENAYPNLDIMDITYLREALSPAIEFIKNHPDKILWCGEFGTIRHANILWRENWMADVITILKENDIPYCVWNYLSTPNDGNRFSLVDDDTRQILSERLANIIIGKI